MTTVESQIIDLQNKMDELQRKQQEIQKRKKDVIDLLVDDYNLHNNNIRKFMSSSRYHKRNAIFKNIDTFTQTRFDLLFKIIMIQNNKIKKLERIINSNSGR